MAGTRFDRIALPETSPLARAIRELNSITRRIEAVLRGLRRDGTRFVLDHSLEMQGAWDGAHLVMGTHHLWVDATGDLRIKNGAPTSDTDGSIIGLQT